MGHRAILDGICLIWSRSIWEWVYRMLIGCEAALMRITRWVRSSLSENYEVRGPKLGKALCQMFYSPLSSPCYTLTGAGGSLVVVGCSAIVVGCSPVVVGCSAIVVDCSLIVVGCSPVVVGCYPVAVGCSLIVVVWYLPKRFVRSRPGQADNDSRQLEVQKSRQTACPELPS